MSQSALAFSVIIPCRNHAAALSRCLDSVLSQRLEEPFEVLVVDSAADDEVVEVVARHPGARIVRSAQPLLPGPARNLGARNAHGAHLAFIDADCTAAEGWLAAALPVLKEGARVVGGAVLDGEPWHPVATIDNLMQFSDLAPRRPRAVSRLLPACNLAIAFGDFSLLGGFPQDAPAAGEDIVFCNRAAQRWPDRVVFCPAMRVRHFGRSTLRQLWSHQQTFGYARGAMSLELRPAYRRLGRWAIVAPVVALKRLSYLAVRAARWRPSALVAMVLFLPVLLFGLTAWCVGFRRGCRSGA